MTHNPLQKPRCNCAASPTCTHNTMMSRARALVRGDSNVDSRLPSNSTGIDSLVRSTRDESVSIQKESSLVSGSVLKSLTANQRSVLLGLREHLLMVAPRTASTAGSTRQSETYTLSGNQEWSFWFDLEQMRKNIHAEFAKRAPGAFYAFVINGHDGGVSSGSQGWARVNEITMGIEQPKMLASVGKVITGAAVMHAIGASGGSITVKDPIWPFFTKHWKVFDSFKPITFQNCFHYAAGILDYSNPGGQDTSLESIQSWYTTGEWASKKIIKEEIGKNRFYNNVCIAWFRIALFYMTADPSYIKQVEDIYPTNQALWNYIVCLWYRDYIRWYIFDDETVADTSPFGLTGSGSQMLYYPYPCPDPCVGHVASNWFYHAGGAGWCLSTSDLARFWRRLATGELLGWQAKAKFLPWASKNNTYVMDAYGTFEIQFDNYPLGQPGAYFAKGGAVADNKDYVFAFNLGATVAIVANCNVKSSELSGICVDSYKRAWKASVK